MKNRFPARAPRFRGVHFAAILIGGVIAIERAEAHQTAPPVQCGFEAPDYATGSIHGQRGWSVEQGRAEIVEGHAHGGARALKLFPADPFSQARLSLAPGVPPAPVIFLDFYVIPATSDEARQEEFLDVDGARIGLFSDPARPGEGVIHVFHGDGAGGGNWLATAVTVPLKEGGTQTSGWVQLSLREDFSRQTWDLWVNGRAAATDVGFQDPDVGHTQNYIIMGDAMESVLLDDLSIQEGNPQGPDADGDGMVDSLERRLGFNHLFDDRDADGDNDGVRTLEEALAALAAEGASPGLVNAAAERPASPAMSMASGFLDAPVSVSITGAPEGGRIRYTTDGSDPRRGPGAMTYAAAVAVNSTFVMRACAVDARGRMSDPLTAAWVFPAAVAAQSRPRGAPEAIQDLRRGGGTPATFTLPWGLDTGDEPGQVPASEVSAALRKAPVVVLAAGPGALFGSGGLYAQSSQRITSLAGLVCFGEGLAPVAGHAAISISGQSSRYHDVTLKHSIRLRFPGPGETVDSVIGTDGMTTRQVVLRHPTHDSWTVSGPWTQARLTAKYCADAFASKWMAAAGHRSLRRQWVHVFLDASYWGVYEAIE